MKRVQTTVRPTGGYLMFRGTFATAVCLRALLRYFDICNAREVDILLSKRPLKGGYKCVWNGTSLTVYAEGRNTTHITTRAADVVLRRYLGPGMHDPKTFWVALEI